MRLCGVSFDDCELASYPSLNFHDWIGSEFCEALILISAFFWIIWLQASNMNAHSQINRPKQRRLSAEYELCKVRENGRNLPFTVSVGVAVQHHNRFHLLVARYVCGNEGGCVRTKCNRPATTITDGIVGQQPAVTLTFYLSNKFKGWASHKFSQLGYGKLSIFAVSNIRVQTSK